MSTIPTFEKEWGQLDTRFRSCLNEAWVSLGNRGLPVGSVISHGSEIISTGRNRVYDPSGGDSPLQGTPIAHAELNAIASARDEVELARCELWTSHEPCSMCRAAIAFTEVAAVHALAPDPSSDAPGKPVGGSGRSDDIWIVVANVMFLHNIAWIGGLDHPILGRNMRHSPEIVALALDLVDRRSLIDQAEAHSGVEDVLQGIWDAVIATAMRRSGNSRSSDQPVMATD